MKEMIVRYTGYNVWANKMIIDTMQALPLSALAIESESSFPTLRDTALHVWSAELVWLLRLKKISNPVWAQDVFIGTFRELAANWQRESAALHELAQSLGDAELAAPFSFATRNGTPYTMPVADVIMHVCNHSTYHRGQLVTQLHAAGATKIPGTDYLNYAALLAKNS